jgi:hypothetical protein
LGESGARELIKKCNLGKGTKLIASFLIFELTSPGNLIPQVLFEITEAITELKFEYVGDFILSLLVQILKRA